MRILFLIFLSSVCAYCQEHLPSNINKVIGLPDSLYKNEIRIYKRYSTTNGTEIFRMYKTEKNKWNAEKYSYYSAVASANVKEHFTKQILVPKKEYYLLWSDMLNTNIAFLPQQQAVNYKLKGKLEFTDENDEWGLNRMIAILDGTGYEIFVHSPMAKNHVNYSNPESYLKEFPGIDELESVKGLLDIIRRDFNLWKD